MKFLIATICYILFFGPMATAQYSVKGRVNLGEEWQPKIFMAAVKKLSDYYRTSPDMIVNTASINSDGTFILEGDNLPNEKQFYRLYLMKKQNTDYDACLYVGGDDHNFVHVLLANGETIEVSASPQSIAPFGDYTVKGKPENQMMQSLARIVFPRFYFHRIKFPTELKFSKDKLHTDLQTFTDSCSNTLVALAAINNTDFDEYFDRDVAFYQRFGERLKTELPNSIYTKNYLLKIRYHANEEANAFPIWGYFLVGLLSFAILTLSFFLHQSRTRVQQLEHQVNQIPIIVEPVEKTFSPDEVLTQKETEILKLICEGKSNKEIASMLFVELSTIKTHINKIYSKIGASNRKEAQTIAKQAFK